MDRQLLFARHFARLVWLLVHDQDAVDEQKVALRAMMMLAREGPVRLTRDGEGIFAGGTPLPAALSGAPELVAGFTRLGAMSFALSESPAAADVLGAARLLAGVLSADALVTPTIAWEPALGGGASTGVETDAAEAGVRATDASAAGGAAGAAGGPAGAPARGAPPRTQHGAESAESADHSVAKGTESARRSVSAPGGPPQRQDGLAAPHEHHHSDASRTTAPPTGGSAGAAAERAEAPASGTARAPTAARNRGDAPNAAPHAANAASDSLPPIARDAAPVRASELPALGPIPVRATPSSVPVQHPVDAFATPASLAALAALDAATSEQSLERALETAAELAGRAARDDDAATVTALWRGIQRREAAARGVGARAAYLDTIERLKRPTVLRALAAALADPALGAEAALALSRADADGAAALVDLLSSVTATDARATYVAALGRLAAAVPTLVRMLRDARWHVARDAATLLGELRATVAEGPLADLLTHEDDRVRRAACGALGRLGTPEAIRALRGALGDLAAPVRASAAACLAERDGAASANTLAAALDAEEDADVQRAILAALGKLGTPDAVQRLVQAAEPDRRMFRRKPVAMRVAAVRALADANSSTAIAALQALANDRERDVREAAVEAARERAARARAARGRPAPAGA